MLSGCFGNVIKDEGFVNSMLKQKRPAAICIASSGIDGTTRKMKFDIESPGSHFPPRFEKAS